MKRSLVVASMALAVGVLVPPPAASAEPCCGQQHGCGHHHGCGGCPSCAAPLPEGPQQGPADRRIYDPDTVTTLKSSVGAVLGPTWFLEKEGLKLAKGDAACPRGREGRAATNAAGTVAAGRGRRAQLKQRSGSRAEPGARAGASALVLLPRRAGAGGAVTPLLAPGRSAVAPRAPSRATWGAECRAVRPSSRPAQRPQPCQPDPGPAARRRGSSRIQAAPRRRPIAGREARRGRRAHAPDHAGPRSASQRSSNAYWALSCRPGTR